MANHALSKEHIMGYAATGKMECNINFRMAADKDRDAVYQDFLLFKKFVMAHVELRQDITCIAAQDKLDAIKLYDHPDDTFKHEHCLRRLVLDGKAQEAFALHELEVDPKTGVKTASNEMLSSLASCYFEFGVLENRDRNFALKLMYIAALQGYDALSGIIAHELFELGNSDFEPDDDEYVFWARIAAERYQIGPAYDNIVNGLRRQKSMDETFSDVHTDPEIMAYLTKAYAEYKKGEHQFSPILKVLYSLLLSGGNGVKQSHTEAVQLYLDLLAGDDLKKISGNVIYAPILNLAIRYLFGLDSNELKLENPAHKFADILPRLLALHEDDENPASELAGEIITFYNGIVSDDAIIRRKYVAVASHINRYISGELEFEDLQNSIKNHAGPISSLTSDAISLILSLSRTENWTDSGAWEELDFQLKCKNGGYHADDITRQSYAVGPFYNVLEPTGLPILGEFENANYKLRFNQAAHKEPGTLTHKNATPFCLSDRKDIVDKRHFVKQESAFDLYRDDIPPGITKINGIRADENGLHIDAETSDSEAALITREDIEVAFVLAFSQDKFQWPSISIEDSDFTDVHGRGNEKIYGQPWMVATDFGRTLYITDYLAGMLLWDHRDFKHSNNPAISEISRPIMKNLDRLYAPDPYGIQMMQVVNVNPREVSLSIEKEEHSVSVKVDDVAMRFSTGYQELDSDDRVISRKWFFLNDTRFSNGLRGAFLSEHFNEIATLLPVYERLKQLMGLMYALNAIEENGYKPPQDLQVHINQLAEKYKNQPHTNELCRHLPVNQNFSVYNRKLRYFF
ncbi:MAG: hypothetical protein QF692_03545 [Alphaproteobacteria bacterium]|nr:hypothetical protein [Alphaproteobacteria bacterium]MDP7222319.1 hypothetical protein [Alphaproteobacteria bacterium]